MADYARKGQWPQIREMSQEAVAAGVKDTEIAQRLRKAMQAVETAMQRVQDSPGHVPQLTDRIAAAEAAGAAPSFTHAAKAVAKNALMAEVIAFLTHRPWLCCNCWSSYKLSLKI